VQIGIERQDHVCAAGALGLPCHRLESAATKLTTSWSLRHHRSTDVQGRGGRAVDLEDIKFHQCVRLTQFDENRQIVFTPPDGEFQLMSYRLSQLDLTPPFWIDCQQEHHGTSRIEYLVKIRSQFKQKVQAQSVEVSVPCPPDCRNPVTKQNAVCMSLLCNSALLCLSHLQSVRTGLFLGVGILDNMPYCRVPVRMMPQKTAFAGQLRTFRATRSFSCEQTYTCPL
jgi:Adaptor complexes medium subunit family